MCKSCGLPKGLSDFAKEKRNGQERILWQIAHIIPQSQLQYSSMEDDNFRKCWSLKNLRPLSTKTNFEPGIELIKSCKS